MSNDALKVVFMLHDGLNYNGGPSVNAVRLLPELQKRGYEITAIATYYDFPSNAQYLRNEGIETITKQYSQYSEDLVRWILNTVRDINPDIFVPNIIPQGGYAARWIKQAGIPTIMTHRSADELNWANTEVFALSEEKWACSGLVCVSEYLKKETLNRGTVHPHLTVIPSGVPVGNYVSDQRDVPLRIVYAGRLVQKQKRVVDMVRSFVALARRFTDIQFTIIGDGEEKASLIKIVQEAGLSHRFVLTGRLVGEPYHQELAKNHVIVLMSDYEGIPGALMDGMACGLVPVTLYTRGVEELVQNGINGFIINDRTDSFYDCITQLISNPARRKQVADQARTHVVANYSLTEASRRWEAFFDKLLAARGTKRKIEVPKLINLPAVPDAIRVTDRRKTDFMHQPARLAAKVRKCIFRV